MAIHPYQIGLKNHHIILKRRQFMMLMQHLKLVVKVVWSSQLYNKNLWAERDSNSHDRSRHILSVVRLPISPPAPAFIIVHIFC